MMTTFYFYYSCYTNCCSLTVKAAMLTMWDLTTSSTFTRMLLKARDASKRAIAASQTQSDGCQCCLVKGLTVHSYCARVPLWQKQASCDQDEFASKHGSCKPPAVLRCFSVFCPPREKLWIPTNHSTYSPDVRTWDLLVRIAIRRPGWRIKRIGAFDDARVHSNDLESKTDKFKNGEQLSAKSIARLHASAKR